MIKKHNILILLQFTLACRDLLMLVYMEFNLV